MKHLMLMKMCETITIVVHILRSFAWLRHKTTIRSTEKLEYANLCSNNRGLILSNGFAKPEYMTYNLSTSIYDDKIKVHEDGQLCDNWF